MEVRGCAAELDSMSEVKNGGGSRVEGSRLAYLLGEMRRQMNGAVVGSMRYYGAEYGLNYGVSIPTIRSIARDEIARYGIDHRFARQLYRQEVRELRLAALWLADVDEVASEIDFWERGIINTEVAEEAAFALLHRVESEVIDMWLDRESELLRYCALLSIAKRGGGGVVQSQPNSQPNSQLNPQPNPQLKYLNRVASLLDDRVHGEVHILPKAIVILFESALRGGISPSEIERVLDSLTEGCSGAKYLREEMAWRMDV